MEFNHNSCETIVKLNEFKKMIHIFGKIIFQTKREYYGISLAF